jgi:branched-chain amino acid aminotransferase
MAMRQPPDELFLESLALLVREDGAELPDDPAVSLYLRPILIASEPVLAVRPSRQYVFAVIAFVTAPFFAGRTDSISVWVSTDYVRAAPGGSGSVKVAGNYAPAFLAQTEAAQHGCQQVVWLDAVERRWVEEMGAMNMLFVHDEGDGITVSTPPLTGTILPGITRDSLLTLGSALGYRMIERPMALAEWRDGCARGSITETIACGTAATVTAVGRVRTAYDDWTIGDGVEGPVAIEMRRALRGIQRGVTDDPWDWCSRAV